MWGYSKALETAGATVHDIEQFGSYQGVWIAHVTLPDGRTGLIHGYYGSCSGCDAFEAELGYDIHDYQRTHEAEFDPTCEKCVEYREKLTRFGEDYFDRLQTPEELFMEHYEGRTYWSRYDDDLDQLKYVMKFVSKKSKLYKRMEAVLNKASED
jgi:hypothetical protein